MTLPETLLRLSFGYNFNQPLEEVNFPKELQHLSFGHEFNQTLQGVRLPDGLLSLTLGYKFNLPFRGVKMPENLQSLTFSYDFDQELTGDNTLPESLRSLVWPGSKKSGKKDVRAVRSVVGRKGGRFLIQSGRGRSLKADYPTHFWEVLPLDQQGTPDAWGWLQDVAGRSQPLLEPCQLHPGQPQMKSRNSGCMRTAWRRSTWNLTMCIHVLIGGSISIYVQ